MARRLPSSPLTTLFFFLLLSSRLPDTALALATDNKMPPTPPPPQLQHIDKLALILVQARRQLVARSKGKTVFFTPGGKREAGESDHEALYRECKEELSIELKLPSVKPYGVFEAQAFGKPVGTMVRMTCYTCPADNDNNDDDGYVGTLKASEEVEELAWIQSDFPREKLTLTGIMILDDLKEKGLID